MQMINCPGCRRHMVITQLYCPHCAIKVEGKFQTGRFSLLDDDVLDFIELFALCRGNIKLIEKKLHISYPTVKQKIDKMVAALKRVKELEQEIVEQ